MINPKIMKRLGRPQSHDVRNPWVPDDVDLHLAYGTRRLYLKIVGDSDLNSIDFSPNDYYISHLDQKDPSSLRSL